MATKLTGKLLLNRIPKELIQTEEYNGQTNKFIWVDILENRDKSKSSHTLQMWTPQTGTIYLANLKEKEYGRGNEPTQATPATPTPTPKPTPTPTPPTTPVEKDDLPF